VDEEEIVNGTNIAFVGVEVGVGDGVLQMRRGAGRSSGSTDVHFSIFCAVLLTAPSAIVGVVGEEGLLTVKVEDRDFEDEIEEERSGGVGSGCPCRRVRVRAVLVSAEWEGTGRVESARA
jgi:hypothetical protein